MSKTIPKLLLILTGYLSACVEDGSTANVTNTSTQVDSQSMMNALAGSDSNTLAEESNENSTITPMIDPMMNSMMVDMTTPSMNSNDLSGEMAQEESEPQAGGNQEESEPQAGGNQEENEPQAGGNQEENEPQAGHTVINSALALGQAHLDLQLMGHPHLFDVYLPAQRPDRVIIFLHGGLGTKTRSASQLGILDQSRVNQARVNQLGVAWIFPQGQALESMVSTWSNRVMRSGVDDLSFLRDLSAWISTTQQINNRTLAGHSNGGMMAHRVWCEESALFERYMGVSGPASVAYDQVHPAKDTLCTGNAPYWAIIGNRDRVINVQLDEDFWSIRNASTDNRLFERDRENVINEQRAHKIIRVPRTCQVALNDNQGVETQIGSITQWSACRGRILLWLINQRLSIEDGHSINQLEARGEFSLAEELSSWTID